MIRTWNREERQKQKDILKARYPDYNPIHHDAFVDRYNRDNDKAQLETFMKNRGIIT